MLQTVDPLHPHRLGTVAWFATVAVGYGVTTQIGLLLIPDGGVSALWPAAGFAAVMMLWAGSQRRRRATLAAIALSYVALTGVSHSYGLAEVGFTVANAVEPLIALPFLARATRNDGRLTNLTSLAWLTLGALLAPLVSGFIAVVWTVVIHFPEPWSQLWLEWWAGDALGLLAFAPLMLQCRPIRNLWSLGRPWEQAFVWLLFVVATVQLATGPAIGLITLAGLVIVGLRLDTSAASVASFVAVVTMAALSLNPASVFETTGAGANIDGRVLILITVLTGELVALGTSARRRATAERDVALATAHAARADAEKAHASLAESQKTLRRALDSGLDAFAIYERAHDHRWRLVFANTEAARRSGQERAALVGALLEAVVPIEALGHIKDMMDRAESTNLVQKSVADLRESDSGWRGHFSITATPMRNGQVVVTWRDVTEEQAAQRHLRAAHAAASHAATHDSLTNLPNRALFRDRLHTSMAALSRSKERIALVFVDLDDFKNVNDRFGHLAGDTALMTTAARLTDLVRESDSVARLGGDEFVMLLPGIDDDWDPETFHARLSEAISAPIPVREGAVTIRASVGVVVVDATGPSGDEILHMADVAMYRSKREGKGKLTAWSNNLAESSSMNRIDASEFEEALRSDQFFLAYQPIFDLVTMKRIGDEALIRWRHPRLGILPPDHFLGLADDLGLTVSIGEWVIDHALADLAHDHSSAWRSVNLAAAHLVRRDVAAYLDEKVASLGVDPARLIVELTESQFLASTPAANQRLQEVRALGVRIAIDDFGAGYSSLSYLRELPFDVVKFDRGLIAGISTPRMTSLLAWVGQLSDTINAMTIIEGIETPAQLELALKAGLRYGQGYYLGLPMERVEVSASTELPTLS